MFVFWLTFVTTIFVATLSITLDEIKTDVYPNQNIEATIEHEFNQLREYISSKPILNGTSSLISYVEEATNITDIIVGKISESAEDDLLVKVITDQIQRSQLKSEIVGIKTAMEYVRELFKQLLKDGKGRRATVSNIKVLLLKILAKFESDNSIFRKFPHLTLPTLFGFATCVTLFNPVFEKFCPEIANITFLPCRLNEIISDYQHHTVLYRLGGLDSDLRCSNDSLGMTEENMYQYRIRGLKGHIMEQPFNRSGYAVINYESQYDEECYCERVYRQDKGFEDTISRTRYPIYGDIRQQEQFMAVFRQRIEQMFEPYQNALSNMYGTDMQNARRKTGFGLLTITVADISTKYLPDGSYCDFVFSFCDPYVQIFIDNENVFRTSKYTRLYGLSAYFETFTSKKISETSSVKLELKDTDVIGDDDLLVRIDGELPAFLGYTKFEYKDNFISIIGYWRPEYKT